MQVPACGVRRTVFVVLFVFQCSGWCAEQPAGDLIPIVVSRSDPSSPSSYSVDTLSFKKYPYSVPLEFLSAFPVDLQSRALRGGVQTDVSLRGAGFQGTAVLLNGQRINDPQTAHHNSDIPLTREDIEKIRIIPGGGSSFFGPDAVGGALQVVSRKPDRREVAAEAAGGEQGTSSFLFSASEKTDALGARMSLEQGAGAGFRDGTDYKTMTAAGGGWLDLPRGEFYAVAGCQKKEFGAYDFYTPGSGYLSREETRTVLCSAGGSADVSGVQVLPGFLWRRHFDAFLLDSSGIRSVYASRHRTDVYDSSIYAEKSFAGLGAAGAGMTYGADEIDSSVMGYRRRSRRGFVLKGGTALTRNINAGFSARSDDVGSLKRMHTAALNIRSSFSPAHAVYGGLARSIRAPSFTELYYRDPATIGNEYLSAEKSLTYQCGYDFRKDRVSADAAVFFRRERGGIDWVKKHDDPGPWRAENLRRADVFGLETRLGARNSGPGFAGDLYYTYLNKIVRADGYRYKYGPNYARHLVNTVLSVPLFRGIQSAVFTYKKKPGRDGWFLADLQLTRDFARNRTLFIKTANVFNVEYQEIEGIPQPGRLISAGIRGRW